MKNRTALRILYLGMIAILCCCGKKQPQEPAKPPVDTYTIAVVHPDSIKYRIVYGMAYDTVDNPAYTAAINAEKAAAYTGEKVPYQGVWFNKEILKAYQETHSPAIAAGNGILSDVAISSDSVTVTFFSHWSRSGPIKFTAKNRIVAECELQFGGIMELHDSEMVFRLFRDSIAYHLVRISDSATLDPFGAIDRLIMKPSLIGEYRGDSGKSLKIGLDRIEGYKECPHWGVSRDYMDSQRSFSFTESVNNYGFDVLNCMQNDDPNPDNAEKIGYQLQADSLLLFSLENVWRIIDTLGRFARKPK